MTGKDIDDLLEIVFVILILGFVVMSFGLIVIAGNNMEERRQTIQLMEGQADD